MSVKQNTKNVTMICLGDSITYGYPRGPKQSWVHILGRQTNIQLVNRGVNGNTTIDMLNRFQRDVLNQGGTHLHLLGGANDAWLEVDLSTSQRCMEEMVRLSLEHGLRPIVGLPTPICHNPAGGASFFPGKSALTAMGNWLHAWRKWLREFTGVSSILLVDYYKPLCLPGTDSGDQRYFIDECHLNETGNNAVASVALKALCQLFCL